MKVVAIVQARMGSTRLPGKVMANLGGTPVLSWALNACMMAPGVDAVCLATSTLPADDMIADYCKKNGYDFWRGSESDVLERFVGAANYMGADIVLRLTADCPFLDPQVIGGVVRLMKNSGAAFCTNVSPRTYPDGLDVQAFTREALMYANQEATRDIDRDGVCTWIERNRSRFPAETLICPIPGLADERWVLDTEADYKFCKEVAHHYGKHYGGPPTMLRVLEVLDANPELRDINKHHPCNERYYEALGKEPLYNRSYDRSQQQFERAHKVIPLAAQTFSKSYLQYPQPSALFLSHGQGGEVFDVDGNSYIDLVSALLPNILGYRDPDVDWAIRRQLSNGVSFSLSTELEERLAMMLCRLIPCCEMVKFGKTGTDVTAAAVRLARAHTGRDMVMICGGYHGWADWSTERNLGVPEDVRQLSMRVPFGTSPWRNGLYPPAAIIVEPDSDPAYLKSLREYCDKFDTVLIFDEVITGFRYDLGGAQELYGVTPDLACFGKAMANGMPLSALVGKREIMKRMEPPDNIFYSGTFFGETLSLAAAIATINKLEDEYIIPALWKIGGRIRSQVDNLIDEIGLSDVISLQGFDVHVKIKIPDAKIDALFRREMMKTGVLVTNSHNVTAAHGPSEIKRIVASYDHTLRVIRRAIDEGDIDMQLAGAHIGSGVRS